MTTHPPPYEANEDPTDRVSVERGLLEKMRSGYCIASCQCHDCNSVRAGIDAALSRPAETIADGWITHDGSGMPGMRDCRLEIKDKNGNTTFGKAHEFDWLHTGDANDIVAYRIAELAAQSVSTAKISSASSQEGVGQGELAVAAASDATPETDDLCYSPLADCLCDEHLTLDQQISLKELLQAWNALSNKLERDRNRLAAENAVFGLENAGLREAFSKEIYACADAKDELAALKAAQVEAANISMKEIKRYTPIGSALVETYDVKMTDGKMIARGDWVKSSDYDSAIALLAAKDAEIAALKGDGVFIPKELFNKLPEARRAIGDLVGYVRTESEKDYFSRLGGFIGQHLANIDAARAGQEGKP